MAENEKLEGQPEAENTEENTVEEVKAEEPVVEEAKVEEPVAEEVKTEEPVEAPVAEEVKLVDPVDAPAAEDEKAEEPAKEPEVEKVDLVDPVAAPAAEDEKVEEPAKEPEVEKVDLVDPVAKPVAEEKKEKSKKANEKIDGKDAFKQEVPAEDSLVDANEPEKTSSKDEIEAKIRKQIEKKQEKQEKLGFYRIGEYLKEEHQWENWVFLFVSMITLVLGCLMLSGALVVKEDFPVLGKYPKAFAWTLVGISAAGLLYALYPFFKPAFPEFKKITWLTFPKFMGNALRTFIFIIVLTLLFLLYNSFITEMLQLIIH